MKKILITCFVLLFFCTIFVINSSADYEYDIPERALILIDQGKFEEAREELNRFRRKQPDNPLILLYIAQIEEEYNRALWIYKEIELLADSNLASEALFRRAEMIFSAGKLSDAKDLYERLIDVYSGSKFSIDAHYRLGIIKLVEGVPKAAIEYFNKCLEFNADDTKRLLVNTGIMECYVALENWNQALETALDVLKEKDDTGAVTPRVLEVITLSWHKLGNEDNANKFTERLLKNYPYSYQAYAIREEGKRILSDTEYFLDSGVALSDPSGLEGTVSDRDVTRVSAKFTVQAMAFKKSDNALKLLRTLKDEGFDARVEMKTVQQTHFFLIRVGYFMTREEADKMVERVTRVTGEKANVVFLN